MTDKNDAHETVGEKDAQFAMKPEELVRVMDDFSRLLTKIKRYNPHVDLKLIRKAFRYAATAHAGQYRKSGQPFIYHGIQTCAILADLNLDSTTLACGLLHDVVEDTRVTLEDVEKNFGKEVRVIIAGLTKIAELHFQSPQEEQAENFRNMLLHIAKDVRVIIVKFADRLHNMRTLRYLPAAKRKEISRETMDVYAPLAHRFGMYNIKRELEDYSFRWLQPREYREVKKSVKEFTEESNVYFKSFIKPIKQRLADAGINNAIQWRLKHLYSIYRKMKRDNKGVEQIYDIFAVRVIVDEVEDCYHTFGIIHDMFSPVVERIKDFIAVPKNNMYQSLHTTVFASERRMIEVQIRTQEMHEIAESGIAAHWRYKEGKVETDKIDDYMSWVREMIEMQRETPDADEFLSNFKLDLETDEIFVFTPKGDVKRLPAGATALDFAFALHSEIGLHCSGVKVDKRMVSLDTVLSGNQWIEVFTNANKKPNPNWLDFLKTTKARSYVRRWINRQRRNESRELAIDMLGKIEKEIERKLTEKDKRSLLDKYHQNDWDHLLVALGSGSISPHSLRNFFGIGDKQKRDKTHPVSRNAAGVTIQGVGNLMVSYAKCCKPVPGDEIVGFVSRGRGVVIHRADCHNVGQDQERAIAVDWQPPKDSAFVACIRVEGTDRDFFLRDVIDVISSAGLSIIDANISTPEGLTVDDIDVKVTSLKDLDRVMKLLRQVKGVNSVSRHDRE